MEEAFSVITAKANPRTVSLRDAAGPLFRRKMWLLSIFTTTAALILAAGFLIPRPYESQMTILVGRDRLDPVVSTEATTQVPPDGAQAVTVEEINSEAELLLSQDLLKKVVAATRLDRISSPLDWLSPARSATEKIEAATRRLAKDLKIKNATNSDLITVSYKSPDPGLAHSVLSNLGNFYVEKQVEVHRPPGSFQFFAEEADEYKHALERAEANLDTFYETYKVSAPEEVRTDLALQLATLTGTMYSARQSAAADEQRIETDEDQIKAVPQRAVSQRATAPADRLLEDLGTSLVAAQTRRTQLLMKYDPAYPLVEEADQEVGQIRATIAEAERKQYVTETTDVDPEYESLREDIAKTRADLAAQRAGAKAAGNNIADMREQMVDLNRRALEQDDLEREVKADENDYLLYVSKREQERTTDALDKARIANVTIAVPPSIPALPLYSSPMVVLVAILAGLVFSFTAVYLIDYFDSSFHSPAQVEESLGIPFVVAVPKKTA